MLSQKQEQLDSSVPEKKPHPQQQVAKLQAKAQQKAALKEKAEALRREVRRIHFKTAH